MNVIVVILYGYHCYQLHTKSYRIFSSQGYLSMFMKLLRIISVDFDVIDQLMGRYSAFNIIWRKPGV